MPNTTDRLIDAFKKLTDDYNHAKTMEQYNALSKRDYALDKELNGLTDTDQAKVIVSSMKALEAKMDKFNELNTSETASLPSISQSTRSQTTATSSRASDSPGPSNTSSPTEPPTGRRRVKKASSTNSENSSSASHSSQSSSLSREQIAIKGLSDVFKKRDNLDNNSGESGDELPSINPKKR